MLCQFPGLQKQAATVSCFLGYLLLEPNHHAVRKSKQPVEGPWRVCAEIDLPAMGSRIQKRILQPPSVALTGGRPCLKCRFVSKINGYCWFEPLDFELVCFTEPANCLLSLRTQMGGKAEGERQGEGRDDQRRRLKMQCSSLDMCLDRQTNSQIVLAQTHYVPDLGMTIPSPRASVLPSGGP